MFKEFKIADLKWIIVGIIVLLLLRECRNTGLTLINAYKPASDTTVLYSSDTIWAKDTIYVFKPKKIFIVNVDTFWKPVPVDTNDFFRVYVSRDTFKNKDLDIFTETHYQGLLRQIKPSYKLKVPIKIIDSIKTTIKVPTLYPPVFQVQIGAQIGKDLISPEVGVSYKRNNIGVGYNLINKTPTLRYSYTIFRK